MFSLSWTSGNFFVCHQFIILFVTPSLIHHILHTENSLKLLSILLHYFFISQVRWSGLSACPDNTLSQAPIASRSVIHSWLQSWHSLICSFLKILHDSQTIFQMNCLFYNTKWWIMHTTVSQSLKWSDIWCLHIASAVIIIIYYNNNLRF